MRKIRLAKQSRSQAVAVGVLSANRSFANAAPSCTEAMPNSTSHTGSIRVRALRTTGL